MSAAAAGYTFSARCYLYKYRIARQSGHRLYLHCFAVGLVFLSFAWLALEIGYWLPQHAGFPILFLLDSTEDTLVLCIGSIAIALIVGMLYNKAPNARAVAFEKAMQKNDYDSILYRAMEHRLPIAISLESRKVYVGFVVDTLEPGDDSHLTLLPMYSGYRDEQNLKFKLASSYTEIFDLLDEETDDLIFYYMAFPRSKIVSLHIYHPHLYDSIINSYE